MTRNLFTTCDCLLTSWPIVDFNLVSDEWEHETACNISQPWNKKLGSLLNMILILKTIKVDLVITVYIPTLLTVGERLQCYSLNRLLTLEVCLTCSISIFLHSFFSFFSFPWHPFVSLNKAVNQPPLSIPFLYITSHFPNHVEFGTTWVEEWRWRLSVFPTAEIVGVSRGKHNIAGWDWLWRGGDMSPSGAPHDR